MSESLYALALLACPVGMGVMMWMMMRGHQRRPTQVEETDHEAELIRLRGEIDQLRARQDESNGPRRTISQPLS